MTSLLRMVSPLHPTMPTRRTFLRLGGVGLLTLGGLAVGRRAAARMAKEGARPHSDRAAAQVPGPKGQGSRFGRAQQCILLFLTGGPPQLDTFDPKPEAPAEIRGEFDSIATSVPGLFFSELFPRLARCADQLCVLRSLTHDDTVHTSAGYAILTGIPRPMSCLARRAPRPGRTTTRTLARWSPLLARNGGARQPLWLYQRSSKMRPSTSSLDRVAVVWVGHTTRC